MCNLHAFREQVLSKMSEHRRASCTVVCTPDSGWTCIKLIRSPFDRVVSSYIQIMRAFRMSRDFRELQRVRPHDANGWTNASFAEFVTALEARAATKWSSPNDFHFMPQRDACDDKHSAHAARTAGEAHARGHNGSRSFIEEEEDFIEL